MKNSFLRRKGLKLKENLLVRRSGVLVVVIHTIHKNVQDVVESDDY